MPANLTPQYQKAELAYRRAQSADERLNCLELMLQLIPKHKGTEKLQADLKTKLKDAREESIQEKKTPKSGPTYRFPRQGAGRCLILGGPNAGKSSVVAALTNAAPEIAPYPFTTREPLPAMMPWEDITVQLIDTPPITDSYFEPYLSGLVRGADAAIVCLDGSSDDAPEEAVEVFHQFRSRKTQLSRTSGFDEDDLGVVHVKTRVVVTRAGDADSSLRLEFFQDAYQAKFGGDPLDSMLVELDREEDREALRNAIYESLDVIRVYTKAPGKPASRESPFTLPVGATVEDLAEQVHRDLAAGLKFAKIWGTQVFDGQSVGREHVLTDQDMVELHT